MINWRTFFTTMACSTAIVTVLCGLVQAPLWYVLESAAMVGTMVLLSDPHINMDHPKWD